MSEAPTLNILAAALEAYDAGLCVIRARTDGTKAPLGKWEHYQHERPTRAEVEGWFASGHPGLGVVCGNVSGDLEMFELEGRFMAAHAEEFLERIKAAGIELLFRRLMSGFTMESPKGGRNVIYRVEGPVDGNTKLAKDADSETLIETRGEGGFVVLAPSHGPTHPSGKPWRVREGSVTSIPTITLEEREALFAVARSFDEAPIVTPPPPSPSRTKTPPAPWTGGQVGESWFDAVVDHVNGTIGLRATLENHDWVYCYTDNRGRELLRRPGKEEGVSGSINDNGRFCPFSTSVPFKASGGSKGATTYDTLDVIAVYEHSGDRNAAARYYAEQTGILDAWKRAHTPAVTTISLPDNVNPETGEITRRFLDDDFWTARETLEHIRIAARSRLVGPAAVLGSIIARIAAFTPPSTKLPALIGGSAPLNTFIALYGASGAGKSSPMRTAADLLPTAPVGVVGPLSLGSGEGIIEAFFELVEEPNPRGKGTRKVKRKIHHGALFVLDEGQALTDMANRKGSTLTSNLRSVWSGGDCGQANASIETRRILPAGTYSVGLVSGWQSAAAARILADSVGGTPQRFIWLPTDDPEGGLDNIGTWPGVIDWTPPTLIGHQGIIGEHILGVDPAVLLEVAERHVAANLHRTIIVDDLDAHRNFARLKLAAILGLLDHRHCVNVEDWELADRIMATSDAVRAWIIDEARRTSADTEMAGHRRAAMREIVVSTEVERQALNGAARAIARRVHRDEGEPVARRELTQSIAGKHRKLVAFEDAVAEAERLQWIVPDGDAWVPGDAQPA